MEIVKPTPRPTTATNSIRTKGKIIDAQYEISLTKTIIVGPDSDSAVSGVDGLFINPGFTKAQWLNCQ